MEPVKTYRFPGDLAAADAAVRAALQSQGFGILTEVDVTATLRNKLGIETQPYRILGACNPAIAHASMQAEPAVGAYLPCGVALREVEDGAATLIYLQNPRAVAPIFGVPGLEAPSLAAAEKLEAALGSIATAA